MANITQALVDATTDMTVAGVTVDVDTRRITDASGTTTTFDDGTVSDYDIALFAFDQTELTGTTFEGCVFHPTGTATQDGMRFTGFPDWNDCTFIHTAGRGTQVWGQYSSGANGNPIGGTVDNCRWAAIGNSGTTPRDWSVDFSLHTGVIMNPNFEGCWIVPQRNGALNFGWTLDGTVRNHTLSRARWSAQVSLDAGIEWTAFINSRFNDNGEYSNTPSDYTDTSVTGRGAHLSSNGANENVYTINTTFENWSATTDGQETYVIIANNGGNGVGTTFRDGYLWNPRFIEAGTATTPVADARILSIPDGVTAATVDLTGFAQSVLLPGFTGGLWDSTAGDALFIQCGMGTTIASTGDVATPVTVPKALNENGGVRPQFIVQPRVKSYTHVSSEVSTGLDVVQAYSGGADGDITMRTSSDSFFPVDTALNNIAYADATGAATTADQIYPFLKRFWYDTETTDTDQNFMLSAGGSELTIDRVLNTGTASAYTASSYTINTGGATLAAGTTITSLNFTHGDAVSLAGYNLAGFAAFTGNRFTSIPVTLTDISLTQTTTSAANRSTIGPGTYNNVDFNGANQPWDVNDGIYMFGTGTTFEVQPNSVGPNGVQYRSPETDANLFPGGVVPAGFTRLAEPTIITAPLTGNYVAVGSDGTVGTVTPVTANSEIDLSGLITATITAPIDIYYKPTNNFIVGGGSDIYEVTKINALSNGNADQTLAVSRLANVLIGDLPTYDNGYVRTMSVVNDQALATYTALGTANTDQQFAKRFLLDITDTPEYLQASAANGTVGLGTAPQGVEPGQRETTLDGNIVGLTNQINEVELGNVVAIVGTTVVTPVDARLGAAGDGLPVRFQPFRFIRPTAGISGAEVTAGATDALIAQNLNTVAGKVNNIEKGVGFQISDGDATNPQITNRSRLSGIQPKIANFDNDAPYEQVFE